MSHPLTPIFNQAQQGRSLQKNSLTSLYKSLTSGSSGASQFLECVDVILSGKAPAAALENALEFVSKAVFIKDAVLMEPCLKLLMDRMECKDKGVRARAVELVARVLACAPPGAALPEGCFEALTPKLLARTGDKFPGVRAAAVRSLERLQECEPAATAAVLTALTQDTAAEVRCAAARSLWVGVGGEALTPLIQRATRDTSSAVRAAALTQLRHAAPWAAFSPPQRRALAGWVGKAPTPIERSAGTLLMATWLWGCSWDVLTLIEGLGLCEAFGEEGVEGVEGEVVPATASQPFPPTLATQAEAAVEGGLFALFAFAEGGRPSGGEALAVQLQSGAGGGGGGGDSTPTTTTTSSPTPMALWEGVKAALATTSPDPNEISPEAALYMWVRSSWLAHHSKASNEDVRGAAVEALNPDAPTLYGVLGAVGAALGCTPLGVGGGGWGGKATEAEEEELDMNDQALRDLVSTAGVPSPVALGCIPSLPTTTDPAALATLHSLLHTAAFVDTPEGPARNSAVGCILTMLPHPSTPSWAVGLLVERLAGCLGCGVLLEGGQQGVSPASPSSLPSSTSAEAYTLLVTLLIALVGSLREGVDVALKRGGEDAAHPSATSSSSSSHSDPCEALRQELEAAQDELMDAQGRGAPGDIAAARRNVAELTGRLGEAERVAAAAVGKQQPAAIASTMMLEEGHTLLPPGDLAGALWLRALTITNCLLGGPKGLVGGGYLPKALLPALLASPNPSKALLRPIPSELREAALGAGGEGGGRLLTSLIVPSMAHPFPPIQREAGRAATLLAMAQGGGEGVNAVLGAFGIGASLLQQATEGGAAPSIKASAIECLGDLVAVVGMGGVMVGGGVEGGGEDRVWGAFRDALGAPLTTAAASAASTSSIPAMVCAARGVMRALMVGAATPEAGCGGREVLGCYPATHSTTPPLQALFTLLARLQWHLATSSIPTAHVVECVALSTALASFFPVYAAMSPTHKAAALGACGGGVHWAMAGLPKVMVGGGAGGDSATPLYFSAAQEMGGSSGGAGVAAFAPPPAAVAATAEVEAGGEDDDDDDSMFIRKGLKRKGVGKGGAAKGAGGGAKGAGRAVASSLPLPPPPSTTSTFNAPTDLDPPSAWLSSLLDTLLSVAATVPLGGGGGGWTTPLPPSSSSSSSSSSGGGSGSAAAAAATTTHWWSSTPATASTPAPLLALSLAADLAADGYSGATFAPALAKALGAVLVEATGCKACVEDGQWVGAMGVALEAVVAATDGKCSGAVEKLLAKLASGLPLVDGEGERRAEEGFGELVGNRGLVLVGGAGGGGSGGGGGNGGGAPTGSSRAARMAAKAAAAGGSGAGGGAAASDKRASLGGVGPGAGRRRR